MTNMTSYTPKKDGAEKAPKQKVTFFENPRLDKLFHVINSRFSAGKNVYVLDEANNQVYVLYPQAVIVRKGKKDTIGKNALGYDKVIKVESIIVEYSTKYVEIYVDVDGKMHVSIGNDNFAYCG